MLLATKVDYKWLMSSTDTSKHYDEHYTSICVQQHQQAQVGTWPHGYMLEHE